MIRIVLNCFFSETLTLRIKMWKNCQKKFSDMKFFGYLGTQIGMNIACSLGIVAIPDSLIIDGISGFVFRYFGAKLSNKINENKNLF